MPPRMLNSNQESRTDAVIAEVIVIEAGELQRHHDEQADGTDAPHPCLQAPERLHRHGGDDRHRRQQQQRAIDPIALRHGDGSQRSGHQHHREQQPARIVEPRGSTVAPIGTRTINGSRNTPPAWCRCSPGVAREKQEGGVEIIPVPPPPARRDSSRSSTHALLRASTTWSSHTAIMRTCSACWSGCIRCQIAKGTGRQGRASHRRAVYRRHNRSPIRASQIIVITTHAGARISAPRYVTR